MKRLDRATLVILLSFCASFFLYLTTLVLPYNLFAYVPLAPISMGEIADRKPLPAGIFVASFVILFTYVILAFLACRRSPSRKLVPLIIALGLAMAILLAFTYPIGAGDVVDYISYGEELAFFGTNPLVVPPAQITGTAYAPYSAFRNTTSNYGPLWTWISAGVVRLLGQNSLANNLLGFKAVAIASYLAQALLIHAILRRRLPDMAPAGVLLFAWNPLVLYEFAVNGHNDATMMAFALLGILFYEMEQHALMTAALTLSFLVKVPTAPLLPLFLLAAARRRGPGRSFWTSLSGGGALTLAIVALGYLSLPDSLSALTNLSGRSGLFTHSLPAIVRLALVNLGVGDTIAVTIARNAALLALGVCYAVQLKRAWQQPSGVIGHAFEFVLFFLLFAVPWFQPWYVTWAISLAALFPRPTAHARAGLLSLSVMFSYVIYGFVWFWIIPQANWGHGLGINLIAVGTTYLAPWAYSLWLWSRTRRGSVRRSQPLDVASP